MQQALERVQDAYMKNKNENLNIDVNYWIGNSMEFGARSSVKNCKYKFSVNREVFKRILLESTLVENIEAKKSKVIYIYKAAASGMSIETIFDLLKIV